MKQRDIDQHCNLMRAVVVRRDPSQVSMVDAAFEGHLTNAELDELQQYLLDELGDAGLGADGEPTEYGLELEAAIDAVSRLYLRSST